MSESSWPSGYVDKITVGECLQTLKGIPDKTVSCCVTSPPYWGLRDYGTAGQIGLEATPAEFVAKMVAVFTEVRRVLRDDGTLWLNLGDCYATGAGKVGNCPGGGERGARWRGDIDRIRDDKRGYRAERLPNGRGKRTGRKAMGPMTQPNRIPIDGLKPKDLVGIPWRVAFALQADGWWLRSDIIWHKPNPMPESIKDRPTKAHEYLFLLTKSETYYFDADAIAERVTESTIARVSQEGWSTQAGSSRQPGKTNGPMKAVVKRRGNKKRRSATDRGCPQDGVAGSIPWEGSTRNKRTVWTVGTHPFKEAHFATFPPDLIKPCILAGSKKGGIVLDPFMGAGTTALVAATYSRRFVGIEINPEYAKIARKRIVPEIDQGKLFDGTNNTKGGRTDG